MDIVEPLLLHILVNFIILSFLWYGVEFAFSFFFSVPSILSQSQTFSLYKIPAILPRLRYLHGYGNRMLIFQSKFARKKGHLLARILGLATLLLTGFVLFLLLLLFSLGDEYHFNRLPSFYYIEIFVPIVLLIWAMINFGEKRSYSYNEHWKFCAMSLDVLIPMCKPKDLIIMEREIKRAAKVMGDSSIYNSSQWKYYVKTSSEQAIQAIYRSFFYVEKATPNGQPRHFVLSRIDHFHKMIKEKNENNSSSKDFYKIRANWAVQIFCFHLYQHTSCREDALRYIFHYRILQGWITKEQAKKEYDDLFKQSSVSSTYDGSLWDIDLYWEEKVPMMK